MTRTEAPQSTAFVVEGPAFPWLIKLLSSLLVAALVVYGLRVLASDAAGPPPRSAWLFMGLLAGFAVYCQWWILRSRTRVSATHIHQTWWIDKQVALADITQLKLVLIPGLTWLVAPRLIVRTRTPGSTVFHAADRQVIVAFARLRLGLPLVP